tara:strand:+ start:558 stop:1064 length:507 start_codon:yes stop_codon:yes gene_type:complete
MALIVENGSGMQTAESYISESDADAYFAKRGSPSAWTALSSSNKESALRYATVTLDGMYEFEGDITQLLQALSWPRSDATDWEGRTIVSTSVPQRVKDATCELALLHLTEALNSSFARDGAIIREKVGSIETEYSEAAGAETSLPVIDRIIGGLGYRRSGVTGRSIRA